MQNKPKPDPIRPGAKATPQPTRPRLSLRQSDAPDVGDDRPLFRKELEAVINRHSMENGSNSPDFILAQYLADCLIAFDKAVMHREAWHGRTAESESA